MSGVIYACKKYGLTDAGRGGEAVYVVAIPFSRLSLEVEIKATGPNFSILALWSMITRGEYTSKPASRTLGKPVSHYMHEPRIIKCSKFLSRDLSLYVCRGIVLSSP